METHESVMDVAHQIQQPSVDNHALFSHDPEQAFQEAQRIVNVVARRCSGPGYIANIKGKTYPTVSWWTVVGASLGLFPQVIYARRLEREDEIAYESRVEIHRNGHIVASAESICSSKEERWATAEEYAIKSMSSTRAAGKCFRLALSFIAVLAGLEPTPAEEIPITGSPQLPQNNRENLASEKQVAAVRGLIENSKVFPKEKRQIHEFLEDGLTLSKSKQLLDFFYGISTRNEDGKWVKSSPGVLENR